MIEQAHPDYNADLERLVDAQRAQIDALTTERDKLRNDLGVVHAARVMAERRVSTLRAELAALRTDGAAGEG